MSYEEKIKIYQSMIRNLETELKHYEVRPCFGDEEFKIRERINMHKEDLRIYTQASKADEYEAKAKAFDEIIYAINSSSNPGLNGSSYIDAIDFTSKAEHIVRKFESECESDA